MKLKRKESEISNSICEYLKMSRYFFWRNNNIPVFDAKRKSFRAFPKWCIKGVPDIFVLTPTRTIALEVKSGTGKQSPDQKIFEELWVGNSANREYYIVRSVEETQKALIGYFKFGGACVSQEK